MCCRMYCYRIWTLLNILMLILIISNNFVVLKSHGIWFELDISGISGNGTTGSGSGGDNRTAAAWIGWWRWCGWQVKRISRGQHVQINTEYPHVRFRFRFCVCVVLLLKFDKIFLKNPERLEFPIPHEIVFLGEWGKWGITISIPRGMRKRGICLFHSPGNEE